MLNERVKALASEAIFGRVCTIDRDGSPHAAPFWISFDGERLYLDTLENRTVRNLRRDPRVAVLIDFGERFEELRGTLIKGKARIWGEDEAPANVIAGVERIREVHAEEIESPIFAEYAARETRALAYVEIIPESAASWNLANPES